MVSSSCSGSPDYLDKTADSSRSFRPRDPLPLGMGGGSKNCPKDTLCAGQVIADHLDQQPAEHQEHRNEDHRAEELDHPEDADVQAHDGVIRQREDPNDRASAG